MYNFKLEVLKRKKEIIKTLQEILKIKSELHHFEPQNSGLPFGEEIAKALEFMLKLGKKDNFQITNVDGYAGHIEYGKQKDWVCVIGHLDVVPAGNDWTYPPYAAQIVDNKIYARGAQDDKGPTIASYFALKILKELKIPFKKRIKLILGLDEESHWRCVQHYFRNIPEIPVSGFIPDSSFPLVYAEKGICVFKLKTNTLDTRIISIQGGTKSNMVSDRAQAILVYEPHYQDLFQKFIKKNPINANFSVQNKKIKIEVKGVAAHGSTPEEGINANDILVKILIFLGIENNFLTFLNNHIVDSNKGEKLGINHFDKETKHTTCFNGVLSYNGKQAIFCLNIRFSKGNDYEKILKTLEKTAQKFKIAVYTDVYQPLLYNNKKSLLVKTLMQVYQKYTQDFHSQPLTIGGGTFARVVPNVVSFGPCFVNEQHLAHQKNEYITIPNLLKLTMIYTEALFRLAIN